MRGTKDINLDFFLNRTTPITSSSDDYAANHSSVNDTCVLNFKASTTCYVGRIYVIFTFFISSHMSLAVNSFEFPDNRKYGHSETWTSAVSWAAIAKVTGDCPFAVLHLYVWFSRRILKKVEVMDKDTCLSYTATVCTSVM